MNRVVHFEIHADDPARARAFYEAMFGWRFDQYPAMDYWLIYTGPSDQPGINGGGCTSGCIRTKARPSSATSARST